MSRLKLSVIFTLQEPLANVFTENLNDSASFGMRELIPLEISSRVIEDGIKLVTDQLICSYSALLKPQWYSSYQERRFLATSDYPPELCLRDLQLPSYS